MFDNQKYGIITEFTEVKQLREHMIWYGHLFFYINDRYYFLYGNSKLDEKGKLVRWWTLENGDVYNERVMSELCYDIYWSTYDFDEIWRAPLFDGKSFENNFSEFIFYDC